MVDTIPPARFVFGPAYLDRVLRVDGPLHEPNSPPIDRSVGGQLQKGGGPRLTLSTPSGAFCGFELPTGWPGPWGTIKLQDDLPGWRPDTPRSLSAIRWGDDLGGMGAGFASALNARLVSALGGGPVPDPVGEVVSQRLQEEAIAHQPLRVPGVTSDWTLLISSAGHGDKLAVGLRGCHSGLTAADWDRAAAEALVSEEKEQVLVVVAGLTNRAAAAILARANRAVRMLAPSMTSILDGELPIIRLIELVDLVCCNRQEWTALKAVGSPSSGPIAVVTDGPRGATAFFPAPDGSLLERSVPVFPRDCPPRDTNRAGEAFASGFLTSLLRSGWQPGRIEPAQVEAALDYASAAAALVLDREAFGFATESEIREVLKRGRVPRRHAPPGTQAGDGLTDRSAARSESEVTG